MRQMKGNRLIPNCYEVDEWEEFSYDERIRELRLSAVEVTNNTFFTKRERLLVVDAIHDEIEFYKNVMDQIERLCK